MKNFMKGVLALWTVLTTIWLYISLNLISGIIDCVAESMGSNREQRKRTSYAKSNY